MYVVFEDGREGIGVPGMNGSMLFRFDPTRNFLKGGV